MTCSIPLSGDSSPNVKVTDLPSIPSSFSLLDANGTLEIPCGMTSIVYSGTPLTLGTKAAAVEEIDDQISALVVLGIPRSALEPSASNA